MTMRQMIGEEDCRQAEARRPAKPDARDWITALAAYRDAEPRAQPGRARRSPWCRSWPCGSLMLAQPPLFLLALPAARGARRRLSRAPVHDPARLRAWLVLPPAARQRLARPGARRADAHPLRLLAAHPRRPSRQLQPSRPPRHRRWAVGRSCPTRIWLHGRRSICAPRSWTNLEPEAAAEAGAEAEVQPTSMAQ